MRDLQSRFGARARALRVERGLTVREVARAVGCGMSALYYIERGAHAPGFAVLTRLAAALAVEVLDLFTFPGTSKRHDAIEATRLATRKR